MVPPAKFIPLAEESGLIVPIGEWVLKTACAQAKAWQRLGLPPLLMSVNLSSRQLRDKELIGTVVGALRESQLDAGGLELEITESLIMENIEENTAKLRTLQRLGVRIAIDDFGTGYSSLSYLAKLPVQTLKIDRSFIAQLHDDPDAATLVSTILALARSLKLQVIAEGVETREQETMLRLMRCDQIQGYLVSVPVPAVEIPRLVKQRLFEGAARTVQSTNNSLRK